MGRDGQRWAEMGGDGQRWVEMGRDGWRWAEVGRDGQRQAEIGGDTMLIGNGWEVTQCKGDGRKSQGGSACGHA